jgi:two-component system sensor histidine kinase YesM
VDKRQEKCLVPKLLLQPLVENAIYHGLKESELEKGNIKISVRQEQSDEILILVEDDGAGMSQEECNELNHLLQLKERPKDTEAYGVLNVHDRIRYSFGDQYGLLFKPREKGGTIVEIVLKNFSMVGDKEDVESADCR